MKTRFMTRRAMAGLALATVTSLGAGCGDEAGKGSTTEVDASDTAGDADVASDVSDDVPDSADTAEPIPDGPLARIYQVAPGVSAGLTLVGLKHLDTPNDTMKGAFAKVRSCTQDLDRGKKTTLSGFGGTINVVSCVPEAKVHPDQDGNYLHITPPATPAEDDGRFAEVMMYHHMQGIHDFYKDLYGLSDRDYPLDALTNIATWIDSCSAWTYAENAAYVPRGGVEYFATGLDAGGITGDAIVFSGTAAKNFSLDASVIYHEYTHAMIGATRLSGIFVDDQGINNLPGALNEAYADYFAATQTGEATVGRYALNDLAPSDLCGTVSEDVVMENYARDLTATRRCPDDLVAEVHADSEIFSSALWAIRERYGKLMADTIALYAVFQLTDESDFESAAAATIQGALETYGAEVQAEVRAIFEARNLVKCDRIVPIERVGDRDIELRIEGTRWFDPNPFGTFVPGYMQFGLVVPAGTTKVTVTLDARSGGGGNLEVDAAVKLGSKPVTYTFGAEGTTNDADQIAPVGANKTFVIQNPTPSPLNAGPWTFSLHNKSRRGVRIQGITATFQ